MQQRSPEWYTARLGVATASRFKDILGTAAKRQAYADELIAERLTGQAAERYQTHQMLRGTVLEDEARFMYEMHTGNKVDEAGFYTHPSLLCGASPDGFVSHDGLVEIKCLKTQHHLAMIVNGMSPEFAAQVQGQIWITGRAWNDFVSYDPRLPQHMNLYIQRIFRDDQFIANLETHMTSFLLEIENRLLQLQEHAHHRTLEIFTINRSKTNVITE